MDIKKAFNTPVLINKVLGNSIISQNSTGSIKNQHVTINPNTSAYKNNPIVDIKNIEISYSELGLLNLPAISHSKTSDNLSQVKYSHDYSINNYNSSVLDNSLKLKSLYDNIISEIYNSLNSKDSISKETYLLLSLQSLINFIIEVCNEFLTCDQHKSYERSSYPTNIVVGLFNSLFSIVKGIKLLNSLIGESIITPNYSDKIINELSASLIYIDSSMNELYKNNTLNINNDALGLINSEIIQCKKLLIIDKTSEILFPQFTTIVSNLVNCINILTDQIIQLKLSLSQESLLRIIYSIQSTTKLIELAASSISLAYFNIDKDYSNIINNLKFACDCAKLISFSSQCPNLFTNFSESILLTKSYSKKLTNMEVHNSSETSENSANSIIKQNITLSLSLYVYNLIISINGTIDSVNFVGTISYPDLYNLNYFGINDVIINTEISIPNNENKFNISQSLALDLNVKDVVIHPQSNSSSSTTFYADINFNLSLNGEIFATSFLPLIIAQ